MARNGSGTYTLASGNPVVTSTTISSTWANNTLIDIATAVTNSIANNGETPILANIPMGTFKFTNLGVGVNAGDSVALDANKNITINNEILGITSTATAGTSTTLTVASTVRQDFTGTLNQLCIMPLLSTMANGQGFLFNNYSTGHVTINQNAADNAGATIVVLDAGDACIIKRTSASAWSGTISAQRNGDYLQTFSVSTLTAAGKISSASSIDGAYTTVASAPSTDIFGASGNIISYNGTTTTTSFVAAAQGGMKRTLITTGAWCSFTASVNLLIDGSNTGTVSYPSGTELEVVAITTTEFRLRTVIASGTWTPTGIGVTFTSASGRFIRIGNLVFIQADVVWPTNGATNTAGVNGFPFPTDGAGYGFSIGENAYGSLATIQTPGYAGSTTGVQFATSTNVILSDSNLSLQHIIFSGSYKVMV